MEIVLSNVLPLSRSSENSQCFTFCRKLYSYSLPFTFVVLNKALIYKVSQF